MTREYLLSELWGYEVEKKTNIVSVYIRYLRKKIVVEDQRSYIQTVHGKGNMIRDYD